MYNIGIGSSVRGNGDGGGNDVDNSDEGGVVIHCGSGSNVGNCGNPDSCKPPMPMEGNNNIKAKIKILINILLKKITTGNIIYI